MGACASSGNSSEQGSASTTGTTAVVSTTATTGPSAAEVLPQGFPTVTIEVTKPDGTKVELCVLLADNEADRSRGLMDVTSLGRYGGMLFRWDEPTNSQFYMLKTRIPLSIAWFAEDGSLVSTADMVPCPNDDDDPLCPRYSAAGPYLDAIELPKGGVEATGITPGSKLTVLDTSC